MKAVLILAAVTLGGAALAQAPAPQAPPASPAPEAAPPASTPEAAPATPPATTAPSEGVTQQGTVPNGVATPPPGTNEPPMTVPAGTPMPDQSAALTPQPATTAYPPCSRTVTDKCVQTYEKKGMRKARGKRRR